MKNTKVANFILLAISAIGGVLVSEQVISGEQLMEVQGITGMALTGGGFTLFTVLSLLKVFPQQIGSWVVKTVGEDKVNQMFNTVNKNEESIQILSDLVQEVVRQAELERQAKAELGVYNGVSQETKDKMGL